jgi:hypothetical protein
MPRVIDVLKARNLTKLIDAGHLTVEQLRRLDDMDLRRLANTAAVKRELEEMTTEDFKRLLEREER